MSAPTVDDYSPENPRDWNPDDHSLHAQPDETVAHECAGTLRMSIGGMKAPAIVKALGITPPELAAEQTRALHRQRYAMHMRQPMHGMPNE